MRRVQWSSPFIWMVCVTCCGCGRETPMLTVFPVHGRVVIDGKPPVRAELRFRPKVPIKDPLKRSIEPYAFVQSDGSFEVGTYQGDDGAPPGEYSVTLVWPTITEEGGEEIIGPDRMQGRFANPEAPIAKIDVKEDDNRIPLIELHSR